MKRNAAVKGNTIIAAVHNAVHHAVVKLHAAAVQITTIIIMEMDLDCLEEMAVVLL